jgi:2-keto-3-deoxy-L-rhamnonate aldolase RhmA
VESCCTIAGVALHGGAAGIMVPYVETVVNALVGAVKLRPMKGRRMSDAIANPAAMEPALAAYLARNNQEHILTINIESRPALENLDALLAVEGLDAVLVGPHDLSVSLGAPESYDSAEFDAAVRTVLRKARANGIGAGVFSMLGTQRVIDGPRMA